MAIMAMTYQKPKMKVIKVKVQKLLAGSDPSGDGGGGGVPGARKLEFEDFE
jgi:hypothetical protein